MGGAAKRDHRGTRARSGTGVQQKSHDTTHERMEVPSGGPALLHSKMLWNPPTHFAAMDEE